MEFNMKPINKELFKNQILEGFTIKQLQEYWDCGRTKVTEHKKKWGFVGMSPNSKKRDNGDGTKTCNTCMTVKPLSEFYSNGYTPKGAKKLKPSCIQCENSKTYQKRIERVLDILDEQDRLYQCELCGYNKNSAALCFHHKTAEKNFELNSSGLNRDLDELRYEIAICAILCHNCHMELHHPTCEL